jgi:hypothetical protein
MSDAPLRVAYLGNFEPPYSTENEYALAWRNNGHSLVQFQEGRVGEYNVLIQGLRTRQYDLLVWTRTRDLAEAAGETIQWKMLAEARRKNVPVIGVHLDRFWDLKRLGREDQIWTEPFFKVDMLFTADGGNQDRWAAADVVHRWLPPGVSERWCKPGMYRDEYASEIAFVGSWDGGYHKEWQHRFDLINWLDKTYGDRVKFWPKRGEHRIVGTDLNDLYWSTKVIVGDSCLVPRSDGQPITHYCSDRIPETLGRGGNLIHPFVEGIWGEQFNYWNWPLDDWAALQSNIEAMLDLGDELDERHHDIETIVARHTYEKRVPQIIATLHSEGLL